MQYLEHVYTKKLFIVYLKYTCNEAFHIFVLNLATLLFGCAEFEGGCGTQGAGGDICLILRGQVVARRAYLRVTYGG